MDGKLLDISKLPQTCLQAEQKPEPAAPGMVGAATTGTSVPLSNYVPAANDPLKIVCLNLHIFQDASGNGNYQPPEEARLRQVLGWVNYTYSEPPAPKPVPKPVPPLLTDTRIRFKIRRIEYYQIQTLHELLITAQNAGTARTAGRNARQAAAVARNPAILKELNVYVSIMPPNVAAATGGGYVVYPPSTQMATDTDIVFVNTYRPKSDPLWENTDFVFSQMLSHELAHCLDLAHTFSGGGASANCNTSHPDFLIDVFGNPSTCPHLAAWAPVLSQAQPKYTNNILGGTQEAGWISPLQAAMMQRALIEKSVRRYVATGCDDCVSCVAFAVSGQSFIFKGVTKKLIYPLVELNETWGWNGADFVAPVRGIYHFDLDFRMEGALDGDVVRILKSPTTTLALASASQGANFGVGGASFTVRLERGDRVLTVAESSTHFGRDRTITGYRFSGHLVCGCP